MLLVVIIYLFFENGIQKSVEVIFDTCFVSKKYRKFPTHWFFIILTFIHNVSGIIYLFYFIHVYFYI